MFKLTENHGDSIPVPQLVFSRLGFPEVDEPRVKVALFMLASGECGPQQVAAGLHIRQEDAEKALLYWEGAGLLQRAAPAGESPELPPPPEKRRHMHTAQANLALGRDPVLGAMMQELQRIFGGVVNQKEYDIYCTLYCQDGFAADLILMAAMHCAAEQRCGASRVERTLLAWRKAGIDDCAAADAYLRLLAGREERYQRLAGLFGQKKPGFTAAERRMVDSWYEEFGYDDEMVEAARLAAGEREREVRYLNGILKRWNAKGYATAADMRRGEEGSNLSIQGGKKPPTTGEDLLQNTFFNPIRRKGGPA